MIAYNKTMLNNAMILEKAKKWFSFNQISTSQMAAVLDKYKISYSKPNIFIRIGLFIFTLFIIISSVVFVSIVSNFPFSSRNLDSFIILFGILFGAACIFFLEKFITQKNWYSNGVNDALLYSALSFIFLVITNTIKDNTFLLQSFLFMPILMLAAYRYIDKLVTIAMVVCIYCFFFILLLKTGSTAKFIMPFAMMTLSAILYLFAKKQISIPTNQFHRECLKVIKAISLLIFYFSGNYFVIRESSFAYFGLRLGQGEDLPFAFIFYTFTALIPLVYLFMSLKTKDKLLLQVSLILIVVSVLTFKNYFSLGPPEISLTIGGFIMLLLAYASIKYLKTDKNGITFKNYPDEDDFFKTNAEALLMAQTFGTQSQPSNNDVEMGGGQFGGGGSGNNF